MAKDSKSNKSAKGQKESLLKKRVSLTSNKTLGKDVKTPKPLRAIWGYLKGSWQELRQVRWPNRRASISLTIAVILFTTFFVVMILLLDYAFEQLFKQVIL